MSSNDLMASRGTPQYGSGSVAWKIESSCASSKAASIFSKCALVSKVVEVLSAFCDVQPVSNKAENANISCM